MSGPIAGAMQTQVLAPDAVTRLGGQATEVRTDVWELTMGVARRSRGRFTPFCVLCARAAGA